MMQGDLALALLVLGVLADDANDPLAVDDLAFVTDWFYGGTDFHFRYFPSEFRAWCWAVRLPRSSGLLVAVDDAAAVQVVWAEFDGDAISGKNANEVLAHTT